MIIPSIINIIATFCLANYIGYSADKTDSVREMQTQCVISIEECVQERGEQYCKDVHNIPKVKGE